jgi:uncharacterized protein
MQTRGQMAVFEQPIVLNILSSLSSEPDLIRAITGPRQVGKTFSAGQIAERWKGPVVFESADSPVPPGENWVSYYWEKAVAQPGSLLILDEIQKVAGWSEAVKALWDHGKREKKLPKVIILGSSSLLLQKGLSESLAGRFYLYRCNHWSWPDMQAAFGMTFDEWLFFGGYPGAAPFIREPEKWMHYVRESLIETVLARDVLQLQAVAKPALLRHAFMLASAYPAQILSYNKMLGQLQDAGNTTTLAHYLTLLESAFLLSGLSLYKRGIKVRRASSPKLILWNNALVTAVTGVSYEDARQDHGFWGRLVENAVGAHLLKNGEGLPYRVFYWRHSNNEVDFIVEGARKTWAIEVKSAGPAKRSGVRAFSSVYPQAQPVIIGPGGIDLKDFFCKNPRDFLA